MSHKKNNKLNRNFAILQACSGIYDVIWSFQIIAAAKMVGKRSAQAGGEVDLRDPGWHEKTCPQQVGKCAYRKIFAKEMLKSDESKIMCQHTI